MTKNVFRAAGLVALLLSLVSVAHAQAPGITAAGMAGAQAAGIGGGASVTFMGGSGPSDGSNIAAHALGAPGDVIPGSIATAGPCTGVDMGGVKLGPLGITHSGTAPDTACYRFQEGQFLINVASGLLAQRVQLHLENGNVIDGGTVLASGLQELCYDPMERKVGMQVCRLLGMGPDEHAAKPRIAQVSMPAPKPVVLTKVMYDPPAFPEKLTGAFLNTWSYRCAAGQVNGGATFCSRIGAAESSG